MSDLISREKAVQGVQELFSMGDCYCDELSIVGMLNGLSSAEPERKKGKWKQKHHGGADDDWFTCSACDVQTANPYNFCPNCGAEMRGEHE